MNFIVNKWINGVKVYKLDLVLWVNVNEIYYFIIVGWIYI